MPALARAAADDAQLDGGAALHRLLRLCRAAAIGGADDGGDARGLEAVLKVLFHQLIRRGDRDRAELVEPHDHGPELPVAAHDQHHAVALLDAQRAEVVRRAGAHLLHLLEGEAALGLFAVEVDHRETVRLLLRDGVHHVKGEVEALDVLEVHGQGIARLVLGRGNEVVHVAERGLEQVDLLAVLLDGLDDVAVIPLHLLVREDHREERAVRAADGDDAVGLAGVVVDAVAGAEGLGVLTDLDLHLPLDDEVELLALVRHLMDGLTLLFLVVLVAHPVGVGLAVFEERRDGADLDARLLGGELPLAAAGDGVAGQTRRVALHQLHDLHAKRHGALVDKGEGKVGLAALVDQILVQTDAGQARHLLLGVAA